ncbi:DNA-3-methyladenine glycosylase I [Dechloromonas hankyongensis]|nr:DNA-3-methyladenine glycosylase I [Dechloromonas hankyongensis]
MTSGRENLGGHRHQTVVFAFAVPKPTILLDQPLEAWDHSAVPLNITGQDSPPQCLAPTICYAFMQASGMVNDHLVSCSRHWEVQGRFRQG